jgi:bacterioferritin-associated ferredoxin
MHPDDKVCLCFHVSMRKIVSYCKREKPKHASQISECLSAGTGCGWCVPFLISLHKQAIAGDAEPDLPVSPEEYAKRRLNFRATGKRDEPSANDPTGA